LLRWTSACAALLLLLLLLVLMPNGTMQLHLQQLLYCDVGHPHGRRLCAHQVFLKQCL